MWSQTDIQNAKAEVTNNTIAEIQERTAYTWGARAVAAFEIAKSLVADLEAQSYFDAACEYRHEAIEHAALAGPDVYAMVYAALRYIE